MLGEVTAIGFALSFRALGGANDSNDSWR